MNTVNVTKIVKAIANTYPGLYKFWYYSVDSAYVAAQKSLAEKETLRQVLEPVKKLLQDSSIDSSTNADLVADVMAKINHVGSALNDSYAPKVEDIMGRYRENTKTSVAVRQGSYVKTTF
jgi:hypothetical protein